jgi:hypothetical protein
MRFTAVAAIISVVALAGCTQTGVDAAGGAFGGGVLGGIAGGVISQSPTGILIGAGIGATTGAILAANNSRPPGHCIYQDRNTGQKYYAPCPPGVSPPR